MSVEETLGCFQEVPTVGKVGKRLKELLGGQWRPKWVKAKPKRKTIPHPPLPYCEGGQKSVHRVLAEDKQKYLLVT